MAKITEHKAVPVVQPPTTYTLELSQREAQALFGLLNHSALVVDTRIFKKADYDLLMPLWAAMDRMGLDNKHPA